MGQIQSKIELGEYTENIAVLNAMLKKNGDPRNDLYGIEILPNLYLSGEYAYS